MEKRLLAFDGVAEAAAAQRLGRDAEATIIKANVVMRDGAARDEDALLAHCRGHLAAYKRPRAVLLLDALPRYANGTLIRAALT